MTTSQQQYISEWHDDFVNFIGGLLGFVEVLIVLPEATDDDKRALDQIKLMQKRQGCKGNRANACFWNGQAGYT